MQISEETRETFYNIRISRTELCSILDGLSHIDLDAPNLTCDMYDVACFISSMKSALGV